MTSIDTAEFRKLLEDERARLVHAVDFLEQENPGSIDEELGEVAAGGVDNHLADVATGTFDRELDEALEDGARDQIAKIDAALRRIDEGTYGTCGACGGPIGEDRLRALPWADLCIDDQRRLG